MKSSNKVNHATRNAAREYSAILKEALAVGMSVSDYCKEIGVAVPVHPKELGGNEC